MSQQPSKIIIAYASAGAGHLKAAEAINQYLKDRKIGEKVLLVDILDKTSPFFNASYVWGYSFLVNHATFLWRFFFWLTALKPLRKITKTIAILTNKLNTKEFINFLCRENPDIIISTHFLPSEVAAYLKFNKRIPSKIITVITDFGIHPFWVCPGTDKYIVASNYTKSMLASEGANVEDILVSGIPVHPKFFTRKNKEQVCRNLRIDKDRFTVLIFTGSFGIGPIEQVVDILHNNIQILVVCARNKKLLNRIKNKKYPRVFIFGFIDNMEELMSVSDLIITKPGGLSIAEILNMELPPIFIYPIPGQETENIKALNYYGIGKQAKKLDDIKKLVIDYKDNPGKMAEIINNIKKLKQSFALEELINAIC